MSWNENLSCRRDILERVDKSRIASDMEIGS
jgi:hypothetical protein